MASSWPHISIPRASQKALRKKFPLIHMFITCKPQFNQEQNPTKYSLSIHLLDLHLPSLPELPPHYHTTNGLPLHLHPTLRKALKMSKPGFQNLLETLKPDLLLHDIILQWAGVIARRVNVRSVTFFTSGATMFSYFCHMGIHPGVEFPFRAISLTGFELSMVRDNIESAMSEEKDGDDQEASLGDKGMILVNSSREIEGKYMDYLFEMIKREIVPIGAWVQSPNTMDEYDDHMIMEWLGERGENSSVFVSFGSEYFLKREEIVEIAYGLELSNVSFIWIIRFPKGEDDDDKKVENTLPSGFLSRVGDRGMIVEKWAPQAKILSHSSIGGFVSHCGWNSLKESIDFGVPIIAMPMHLDQPMNARLVVELGVGVEVKRDDRGMLHRDEISKVVKDVVKGEIGGNLRRKIGEQGEKIRLRSREEIDGVVEKLKEVCGKSI